MENKHNIIFNIMMIIVAVFTVVLQIFPPENQNDQIISSIYFFGIIFYIIIVYLVSYYFDKGKKLIEKINSYADEIKSANQKIKEMEEKMNIDKRLSILESHMFKGKKGNVDPRWILIILLFILFYLYLKSIGVI